MDEDASTAILRATFAGLPVAVSTSPSLRGMTDNGLFGNGPCLAWQSGGAGGRAVVITSFGRLGKPVVDIINAGSLAELQKNMLEYGIDCGRLADEVAGEAAATAAAAAASAAAAAAADVAAAEAARQTPFAAALAHVSAHAGKPYQSAETLLTEVLFTSTCFTAVPMSDGGGGFELCGQPAVGDYGHRACLAHGYLGGGGYSSARPGEPSAARRPSTRRQTAQTPR
jgi:hypothetical protein